jgi:hypothetical protein
MGNLNMHEVRYLSSPKSLWRKILGVLVFKKATHQEPNCAQQLNAAVAGGGFTLVMC